MARPLIPIRRTAPSVGTPSDLWRSFRTEMDRMFDRVVSGWGAPSFPAFGFDSDFDVSPAVDTTEDEKSFLISAELPGMSEKDVEVSLAGNTLTIKGEKRKEKEEKKRNFYLSERSYGAFRRSFVLPEGVDSEKISATFANGMLTVSLPKTALAAPKQIEVKAAA